VRADVLTQFAVVSLLDFTFSCTVIIVTIIKFPVCLLQKRPHVAYSFSATKFG